MLHKNLGALASIDKRSPCKHPNQIILLPAQRFSNQVHELRKELARRVKNIL